MSADNYNKNICNRIVISQDSMDQFWNFEVPETFPYSYKYDPGFSTIYTEQQLSDEQIDEINSAYEQGDERSVAKCRAEYDLNGLSGGFCC